MFEHLVLLSRVSKQILSMERWNTSMNLRLSLPRFCESQGGPNWAENVVDSPIIVNEEIGEFYKNPSYYALGHVSR